MTRPPAKAASASAAQAPLYVGNAAATLAEAREKAYAIVDGVKMDGGQFRTDIALAASLS